MARKRYPLPVAAAVVCGSFWLAFGERADPSAPDDTGPGIAVVNVFTPQTEEAYANVRIPALAVSKEGTLLAFAEGRRVQSDHNKGPLVLRRSEDGGRTWNEIQVIAEHGNDSLNNPTPVVLANGRILVVYQCFRETFHSRAIPKEDVQMAPAGLEGEEVQRNYIVYSDDDGVSWSAPRDITAQIKRPAPIICNFTGPGPGLVMKHGGHAGRIILPSCDFEIVDGKRVFRSYVTWSDDNGETWQIRDLRFP